MRGVLISQISDNLHLFEHEYMPQRPVTSFVVMFADAGVPFHNFFSWILLNACGYCSDAIRHSVN